MYSYGVAFPVSGHRDALLYELRMVSWFIPKSRFLLYMYIYVYKLVVLSLQQCRPESISYDSTR